jgi:hypothetical protein
MCDQVVALLSPEYSTSLVWNDEDAQAVGMDTGDSDRLFTFEVAKTNEQEENAVARPGFQVLIPFLVEITLVTDSSKMHFRHISHNKVPPDCPVDPVFLLPRLLPGETAQGALTATYIPQQIHTEIFDRRSFSEMSLKQLL